MNDHEKPAATDNVQCKTCLKEIPQSEAKIAEASDYVLYFCGLDCYEKWQEENEKKE